jgi:hypothetical protein
MAINESIYFYSDQPEMVDKGRYDSKHDTSVIKSSDLRKTRLTLSMINSLRKASDAREQEKIEELELVKKMYSPPEPEAGGGLPL